MKTSFHTIAEPSEGFYKDRGSKFMAFAWPVENESEIKSILEELWKKYHDARHHCYAWKTGTNIPTARANDDGEPANSAGKPILNQIDKLGLTNILVVVIRYFGGTLLGVGGLINAYRTATEIALQNSRIIKKLIMVTYSVHFPYPVMNDVMKIIKVYRVETYDQQFEISCSMKMAVELSKEKTVVRKLELIEGFKADKLENI
ncbi:MAG: YigZ family protein [Bacteroidales bacterium]